MKISFDEHSKLISKIDEPIGPLVDAINSLDYCKTTASCAGHSLAEIEDFGLGWRINIPYRITLNIHVRTDRIRSFIGLIRAISVATNGYIICELGYHPLNRGMIDTNNITEDGYTPFFVRINCETKKRRDEYLKRCEDIVRNRHFGNNCFDDFDN